MIYNLPHLSHLLVNSKLNTRSLGRNLSVLDVLPSTNTYLKELAKIHGLAHGASVIAEHQSGGRGRLGRDFFSPTGGLYMSVLLKPAEDAGDATARAAVAVKRACFDACRAQCRIKWVNDIYLDEKKICGILVEGITLRDGTSCLVCGIGVNLRADFPPEIEEKAGNLPFESRETLAALILNRLEQCIEEPFESVLSEYRACCLNIGKYVSAKKGGQQIYGKAVDIGEHCELIIEKEGGERIALNTGEATLHEEK